MHTHLALWQRGLFAAVSLVVVAVQPAPAQPSTKPYKVTIVEEKPEVVEMVLPVDPAIRAECQYVGNMSFGVTAEGKMLTCGAGAAHTLFKIDNNILFPNGAPQLQPLPEGPNKKKRHGGQTVWQHGDVRVTMIIEVIPGKPYQKTPGAPVPRRMDTLLFKYVIENTGNTPHNVGCRMHIDTLVVNNDGAIFASPTTHPNKLLDGIMLQGKNVPDFLEILQIPDLNNPGFKGIFTFKFPNKLEGPGKIVLTSLRAGGQWDVQAMPAMGDSACAFFWEPQDLKPKSKREIAFAYGQGIACNPENEGRLSLAFGGSFEPNKTFTVTAYVDDPLDGQSLTLLLPKGVERLDAKDTQTVPQPGETGQSVVMWRCRLAAPGSYPIRIRSSNGVTQTRLVTVAAPE
jgi:hypothetical protein